MKRSGALTVVCIRKAAAKFHKQKIGLEKFRGYMSLIKTIKKHEKKMFHIIKCDVLRFFLMEGVQLQ